MTKAKMDYLWAPKDEKLVSSLLDSLGIEKVGTSERYPTGVKYDALVAICDVISANDKTASMVASRTHELQSQRKVTGKAPSVDSVVAALASGKMSEADLKKAMKKAGLIK
jgi:hypothetical protein|tara:strand:+ start:320 stop:652 length:333 start_codon:yes stop_codon:yes gene_type:complete